MNRIRELRVERGWTQGHLARQLSTKPQSVSRYEAGERGIDVELIDKLCEIFDVTADYLLGRSPIRSFNVSEDEAQLLDAYRSLSPTGKEFIRHSIALASLGHNEVSGAFSDVDAAVNGEK